MTKKPDAPMTQTEALAEMHGEPGKRAVPAPEPQAEPAAPPHTQSRAQARRESLKG
jgi:hypothetical protein